MSVWGVRLAYQAGVTCVMCMAAMLAGCGDPGRPDGRTGVGEAQGGGVAIPYQVVATVGMVGDIVREVAGERAEVQTLIGAGVDPHAYTPRRSDVVALNGADIIFYNGLMLEGKMADVLVRVARAGKPVHPVSEGLLEESPDYLLTTEEDYLDPHIWMDVQGWIRAVRMVTGALTTFDPQGQEQYEARAEAYMAKLTELDAYAREVLGSIPEAGRVLVTAHDAFSYLGRAYGLEVMGIQGVSTESEAGVQDIERLVRLLVDRQIPAVFVETSVADKNVRALLEGASARGHTVRIGGELFSDAMGPAGTYEGTYVGMIDHNVTVIARALGGEAPERGFQGRLSESVK